MNAKKIIIYFLLSILIMSLIMILIMLVISPNSLSSGLFWILNLFFSISGACIIEIYVLLIQYYRKSISEQKKAPIKVNQAKVFSKAMSNSRFGSCYYISFILDNGARTNMKVTVQQYNTIRENESGILTYKENGNNVWFVSFQPNLPV